MASIPLPALNVRTPEQPDLLQRYSQLMALKNAAQQSQIQQQEAPLRIEALRQGVQQNQLQIDQQQQAQREQQAYRTITADPKNKGKTFGEIADLLSQSGSASPQLVQQLKKFDLDQRTGFANLDEKSLTNLKAGHAATQELYNNVMNLPDDQLAANWPQIARQYDAIPGNQKLPLDPNQPLTKEQLKHAEPFIAMQNAYLDEELERRDKAAKAKLAVLQSEAGGTSDEARIAQDYLQANGLENTPANRQKAFDVYTNKTKIEPAGVRAQVFLQTPTQVYDPKSGKIVYTDRKSAIGMESPQSPGALASKGDIQADVASLKKMQTNFDNVTAFEKTAGKNLDTFLQTAKGVVDSGSPLINSPLRTVTDRMAGSEKQAAFNAARATALTEISKVLNSSNATGVLSDSARHEVEGLIGPNATLKQIYSAAKILKQDMENRRVSYQEQIDTIKGRMGGQAPSDQPNAPPAGAKIIKWADLK